MNILFIHGNYPAQFRNLASDLGAQGIHDIRFLTARKDPENYPLKGITVKQYQDVERRNFEFESEAEAITNELIRRGEIVQKKVLELIQSGFTPRLIIFHGGNGLGLFLRQILPKSILIGYFEWYFSSRCAHLILNRKDLAALNYIQARNTSTENEIISCDECIVPTEWQARQFPGKLRGHLNIIFDGIDFSFFKPASQDLFKQTIKLEGENASLLIKPQELLLTYATRGMEPMRGFPDFIRALPQLLEKLPNLKVLIGGRDRSAYGPACPTHEGSWKNMMLEALPELQNHPRIVYTGLMNYQNYLLTLQRSNLHIYLTQPYVTSWSLFETMACGTPVITNRSLATNGTLPIPEEQLLENIEDIHKEVGITKILASLENKTPRASNLPPKLSLTHAKHNWQNLVNKALNNEKASTS